MNKIDNLDKVRENKEGILSLSLPVNGGRWEETEFLEIIDMCVKAGMNQLLTIMVDPQASKVAETAPAEIIVGKDGIEKGSHLDMVFPSILNKLRKQFPDLPLIASVSPSEVICYGGKRFLLKCVENGIEGLDLPLYPAIDDPFEFRKFAQDNGIRYFCSLHAHSLDLNNPVHMSTYDGLIRISTGELFLVTAIPTTENGFNGNFFNDHVKRIRKTQEKYGKQNCKILSIGGIATPEDAYQLVQVAHTDGVHFSSKFLNKLLQKQPLEQIEEWIKQVKSAMQG